MTITKAHIVEALAEQNGYPKNLSSEMVETLLEIIKRTLESGEDVLVSGFGKFCVKEKHERRGRNPSTGEDMMLEPRRVAAFRCSRQLRDKINGKPHKPKVQFIWRPLPAQDKPECVDKGCINSAKKNYLTATNI
jgi:integration host factor subunit alpha